MNRILKKAIFSLLIIILSGSCASTPKLVMRTDVPISSLGINLLINPAISDYVSVQLQKQLDDFIISYNSRNYALKVNRADSCTSGCLQIKIHSVELVSPERQTTGVIVSLLGFSMPFILASAKSPIVVAFWYFPRAASLTELSLSPDINASPSIRNILTSPAFLKSQERQVIKHREKFGVQLWTIMGQLRSGLLAKKI